MKGSELKLRSDCCEESNVMPPSSCNALTGIKKAKIRTYSSYQDPIDQQGKARPNTGNFAESKMYVNPNEQLCNV